MSMARAIARGVYEATALPFPGALPAWKDPVIRADAWSSEMLSARRFMRGQALTRKANAGRRCAVR